MEKLKKFYPPGYPVWGELAGVSILLGMTLIMNIQFLFRLTRMRQRLFEMEGGEHILMPEVMAQSFMQLTDRCWTGFVLALVVLAIMAVERYLYYWSLTKSIYVMRRIPKRGVILASCIKGSVLWAVLFGLLELVLFGLYLGLYWLLVPAEWMPRFW